MKTKPFETIVRREYLDYLVSENEKLKKELVLNKLEPIHLHNCLARISELEEKNKNAREKVKKIQEQLKEANEVIKHYANDENWCDYYDEDDEKMTKSLYIGCNGPLEAQVYLKKWGIK